MNEDDSIQMANILEQMGCREAVSESDADIILLNTCSVRAKPEQKVRSKLGELRLLKMEKPNLIIGVCGCMAQREGESLLKRAPSIDIIMGTASVGDLSRLIQKVKQNGKRAIALDLPERGSNGTAKVCRTVGHVGLKALVPVMYGCNNFCAYCVVPSARGPERSRPSEEVVAEVRDLVSKGCREVTLVGQNVNSYGKGSRGQGVEVPGEGRISNIQHRASDIEQDFAELLRLVSNVEGLERIRFVTSHPKDLSNRLIGAIADLPKVCKHLHLPLQSGDDQILSRMGRMYNVEHYLNLVQKLRERVQGIALTTDVMVGFPGETEKQYRNTLETVKNIRYDGAFMFAFNPRPGTAAEHMDGQLDGQTKMRRLRELISVQNDITLEKNKSHIGEVFEVLVEGPSDKDKTLLTGYTGTNKVMILQGSADLTSRLVMVKAVKAHPWGYSGELVE